MIVIVKQILEKSPVLNIIKKESIDYVEINEIIAVITNALKNYDKDEQLQIGIVGEVKSGKSTLINALIGEEVSPVGITETTGSVIKFNNQNGKSFIEFNDNKLINGTYENIKEKVDAFGSDYSKWENVSTINFDFENEFLNSFTLIDTPGLQTLNKNAENITEEIFEKIDLVIWVFNYTHYDQDDIQDKLEEFIEKYPKPLIAVINKTENVLDKEQLIKDFKNKFLYFPEIKEVFPMSALNGFMARKENDLEKLKNSGINRLIENLEEIKKQGSQKVKYERNKEFVYGLAEKYIDFHKKILSQITEQSEKMKFDLNQEALERDLLLDILKSNSRKFSLLNPEDVFEKEINEVHNFIESLTKDSFKKNNLQVMLEEKLALIFKALFHIVWINAYIKSLHM